VSNTFFQGGGENLLGGIRPPCAPPGYGPALYSETMWSKV